VSMIETLDEPQPRLATASGGSFEPPDDNVISWRDLKEWKFLLYCKAYIEAYPNDIENRLVYRNLLRAYTRCA